MTQLKKRVLVYGYGNPGREDDGLGIEMIKMVQEWIDKHKLGCMTTESNYQLNIEDAEKISEWDIAVFVDASKDEDLNEFIFRKVEPSDAKVEFTMHAVSPSYVLHLSEKLFKKSPETYILGIKGYKWDFKEGLSANAKLNLEQAFQYLTRKLAGWALIKKNLPISMLS
ncbi:MAG: hydrogenase maturation protease [Bacteroidetes bacterium]|nr:hydrogenase maturation protease [Bacteroidota bacterium]MBL6942969.1 hydrogenase maturation protease [Bacteroidales bacterium]